MDRPVGNEEKLEIIITEDMVLNGVIELNSYDFEHDESEQALIRILSSVFSKKITVTI